MTLFSLVRDIRGAGETNSLKASSIPLTRSTMLVAAEYYAANFARDDGNLSATMELVTLTGWKPAPTQQQPARRGSGTVNLNDIL